MTLQSEKTETGPVFRTEPAQVSNTKNTPRLYPTPSQSAQAGNALVDVWLTNIAGQARMLQADSIALERAANTRDPYAIETRAQSVSETAGNIAGAIEEAIALGKPRGPSPHLIAEAAQEYRRQRGDRVSLATDPRTYDQVCADLEAYERAQAAALRRPGRITRETWRGVGDEPSAKTRATRDAIKRAHPAEWIAGARAGFTGSSAYPQDFSKWSASRRDAWFAGFNQGLCDRMKDAARKENA